MKSQNLEILSWLKKGRSITALEALRLFGCMRLAARIHDLKESGNKILATPIKRKGKWIKRYSLLGIEK